MKAQVFKAWQSMASQPSTPFQTPQSSSTQSSPVPVEPSSLVTAASDVSPAHTEASDIHYTQMLLQCALRSWRAFVLHRAQCHSALHQAALASAERAVKKGCQAAAADLLSWNQLSAGPAEPAERAEPAEPQSTTPSCPVTASQQCVAASAQLTAPSSPLTASFPQHQAAQHHTVVLLKQAFTMWQHKTQLAVHLLYQRHVLKAAVNKELVQVHEPASCLTSPVQSPCAGHFFSLRRIVLVQTFPICCVEARGRQTVTQSERDLITLVIRVTLIMQTRW